MTALVSTEVGGNASAPISDASSASQASLLAAIHVLCDPYYSAGFVAVCVDEVNPDRAAPHSKEDDPIVTEAMKRTAYLLASFAVPLVDQILEENPRENFRAMVEDRLKDVKRPDFDPSL